MSSSTVIPPVTSDQPHRALMGRMMAVLSSADDERGTDRRNAVAAFAVRVASAAILFASQVILARWMGGHDYGTYIYAWTWVLILGALATLGFNYAAIRLVASLRETGSLDELRGFLAGGRLLVVATGTAIAGAGALAIWLLSGGALTSGTTATVLVILLAVPAYAMTDVQDGIGRGSARLLSGLVAPYIVRPIMVLACIGAIYLAGIPLNATIAASAAVAATWAAWAVQTGMIGRQLRTMVPAGPRDYRFRKWFGVSLPLMVICAAELALQNTDVIVISNMLTPTDAGIYFAAAKTMGLILFVHYAVGSSMANRFAAISARGDTAAMRTAARDAVRWTFWPSLVLGLGLVVSGRPLLSLFGPQFVDAYPVMCVLVLAFMVRAAVGPVDFLLNMSGAQADCARTLAAVAVLNLLLNLLLVPIAGLMGAALAVSLSLMLAALVNYRIACRRLGFGFAIWSPRQDG